MTHHIAIVLLALVLLPVRVAASAQSPQHHVAPPANALADGAHALFVAGTTEPHRELLVIDGSLLVAMQGRRITAIELRRDVADETFAGGAADLTVHLSHAARSWSDASDQFDQNHGQDRTLVFQGAVQLPTSPPAPGPDVAWDSQNVLSIALQTPFDYVSGAIALEIRGAPDAVTPTEWWPADAVWQPSAGTAISVGNGCGPRGGPAGEWAFLDATNLVPGGTATFTALGMPNELACLVLGAGATANAIDLAPFGAPGCHGHLQVVLGSMLTFFGPQLLATQPATGARALLAFRVPGSPAYLGLGMTSQWLAFGGSGLTSSNAHAWTLATTPPAMPMTMVTAHDPNGTATTGTVVPGCGHVVRFTLQ